MKNSVLALFFALASGAVSAQVGIGTSTPNTHAVLELKSPGNNQGLLAPALTTAQRTAPSLLSSLGSSENGLIVYDSDDQRFYFWKDTNWEAILSGAVSGVGTVLSVGTGTGLSGGPITSTGTISLANTTVSPGTYGSATQVSQFAVDAQGRITSASNVAISGVPPTGTAGGDLTGTFPNPGVASLRGNAVSATAPATNQILKWNGSAWTPAADANSGGTVTSVTSGTGLTGGPITGAGTISLANTAVTPATYGDATHVSQIAVDAQGRITSASSVTITGAAPTGAAGGDLTGNYPNPTITTNAVTAAKIAAGDYSTKINTGTYSISITGNAATATTATNFSGALVGDVTGTQGATVVGKLQGSAVSATAPTLNQILKWNGSSWLPSADANSGGTVTSVASGTGLTGGPITGSGTIALANTAVTPATYGDATHVSQFAVDAQGRITSASSVTITGAAPTGAAGGDLTGNFPNPTIAANAVTDAKIATGITASKLSPSVSNGQVLTTVAGATSWAALPASVTTVATGTGLTGGPITGSGTISLANTAVTPSTYGDATHVSQIAVDAQGRITSAASVTITGAAPTGAAGGDLTGNYPNPTITTNAVTAAKIAAGDYSTKINTGTYSISITGNATTATNFSGALAGDVTGTQGATVVGKLQGSAVSATAPTLNQILKWNGSSWLPSADANSGGTVTSVAAGTGLTGGPITGTGTISLANTAVTAATYGDGTHVAQVAVDAQGRITTASSVLISGAPPTGAAGGDLTGTYPSPTITANAVTAVKIAAGDYSTKINTGTYSISITGNATTATTATNFSGALAGDVTGTQGVTVVGKLQGSAISATVPTLNQILKWNGSSWLPSADANSGGTVTSVATSARLTGGPITATGTLDLATSGVTAASYGSTTQVAQIAVDAYGRITSASNVAIAGLPPTGTAGGALAGTYPNPTIATGAVTTTSVLDGTLANIDISATAAIVDSKLATIITAGKVSGSAITSGTIAGTTAINSTGSIITTFNSATAAAATFTNAVASSSPVVQATAAGTSAAIRADQNGGTGNAIGAFVNNTTSAASALHGASTGTGNSINGVANGNGIGVYGTNSTTKYPSVGYLGSLNYGVYGQHQGYAVYGINSNSGESGWIGGQGYGVYGSGNTAGVYGTGAIGVSGTTSSTSYGVYGNNTNTANAGYGVYGETGSPSGYGVYGSTTSAGVGYGVFGNSSGSGGYGIYGLASALYSYGVYGKASASVGYGVFGVGYYGIYGSGTQYGIVGSGGPYGVYGSGTTYGIYSSGPAGGTTTWTSSSDIRLKKNIKPLTGSLEKILRIRGVGYDWRREEFPAKNFGSNREIGVIAQEIKEVLPEVVSQDPDGYYSVSYEKVVPVLVEAMKEQQVIINDQKAKIAKLEKTESEFATRLAALEALVRSQKSEPSQTLTATKK